MTITHESAASEMATGDLLAAFREAIEPLGVRVERVADPNAAATIIAGIAAEVLTSHPIASIELIDAAPCLVEALTAAGLTGVPPGAPTETRDQPLGLALAQLAVAETGSVLLAEPTLEDRAVGLVTKTLVVLCPTEALVPSLDEAAAALYAIAVRPGGGYATLVTGPSRTADIELTLTVGVQGPGRLIVLFVDEIG